MKGYDDFLASLLPGLIVSTRIRFGDNKVEASVKEPETGNLIIVSTLETDCDINEEIGIPDLAKLQKAHKVLNNPKLSIHYEHDTAYRLNLKGQNSKVSMFLADPAFTPWPKSSREPDYSLVVDLPAWAINSMKSNYSLVESTFTRVDARHDGLTFTVGDEAHENSASTTIPTDDGSEYTFQVISAHLSAIINSVGSDASVTLYASEHKMVKFVVTESTDDYSLTTSYYVVARGD